MSDESFLNVYNELIENKKLTSIQYKNLKLIILDRCGISLNKYYSLIKQYNLKPEIVYKSYQKNYFTDYYINNKEKILSKRQESTKKKIK